MSRNRRILGFLLTIALAIGFLTAASHAKVAGTSLKELTQVADVIVVGRVVEVGTLFGVRVAKVEVRQTLKGKHHPHLYYLAQRTWICDISGGNAGEEALFFFSKPWVGRWFASEAPSDARLAMVQILLGDAPFMAVAWSGRGTMKLRKVQGKDYVTLWTDDVALPADVPTIAGSEEKYTSFIRSAPLSDILAYVRSYLQQAKQIGGAKHTATLSPRQGNSSRTPRAAR